MADASGGEVYAGSPTKSFKDHLVEASRVQLSFDSPVKKNQSPGVGLTCDTTPNSAKGSAGSSLSAPASLGGTTFEALMAQNPLSPKRLHALLASRSPPGSPSSALPSPPPDVAAGNE